ncbi:spoIIIJ-associated protein [Aneurinibacillus soli]|uniref:RNA-binding protein KhpB n=1 Tax=Aneurinibacillus soli TaxID=1500254 RepID=A0A0U5AVQ6_9BACL|nr:RNA-binding cell elongation regulator Jag/EloR [Aneurinibacillus soli]PYE61292.1 spoIIIJ-associated protein [Aneurinibacillus soli]BAU26274.1 R3H domain protein [Aneurinibacillus soli]
MNQVTATGKTVEDAIRVALAQLNAEREDVSFRVLEEPSKGFLGLIGVRKAKVEVTLVEKEVAKEILSPEEAQSVSEPLPEPERLEEPQESKILEQESPASDADPIEQGRAFLEEILATMDIKANVQLSVKQGMPVMTIVGKGLGLIIGRRGQTLDSLQYLVNIVANRNVNKKVRIVLDAEKYRQKRKESLVQLAERMATQVIRTKKVVRLEPMNPTERKVIHSRLQKHSQVQTYSEGTEPYRRVVITLKKQP